MVAVFLILPVISADIIIQQVDETSGIILDKNLNVELRDAIVKIDFSEEGMSYLTATFEVYSNEKEKIKSLVYLKAKGEECYGSCRDVEVAEHATWFNINNNLEHGHVSSSVEGSFFAEIYEIDGGKFAGVEFDLLPQQVNTIKISQEIILPFAYYLDSLSTFTKADHEKITIKGENLRVEFNEYYPINKISEDEWVWEYYNLDTSDENLKDILIITEKRDSPSPSPGPDYKYTYYIIGAIVLLSVIVLIIIRFRNSN